MDWFWWKTRSGKAVEAGLHILDTAIGFGLVAVVVAFGKFLLGGFLAALALGVFVRLTRRMKSKASARS